MRHLIKFSKFRLNEFVDFEKKFDIDEKVLSFVFSDVIDKYTHIGIRLEGNNNRSFKIELYDEQPSDDNIDLSEEFNFLKQDKIYSQIEAHFTSMDFKIKSVNYDKERNIIEFLIEKN